MDYEATLAYLDEVQARGIKLGLENMRRLLADMGDPQESFPAVVVAGTNGKGSVSAFLASIFRAAGRRTGLYTSPHLVRYEERVAVDGIPVTREEFAHAVTIARQHVDALMGRGALASHPTHFEILTAAAFHHFRQRKIEIGVLEVGMGGRLDAVAVARTIVAVITNITLEHTKYLGETISEIAREKAGIIREGCSVVTAETKPEALSVIRGEAAGRGVRLVERHTSALVAHPASAFSARFRLRTDRADYGDLMLPLAGRHQIENATLAVLAAEEVGDRLFEVAPPAIIEGLASTQWPGRLQVVGSDPLFLLDGAHNPGGCEALARALRDLRDSGSWKELCLIFGVLQDKELEPMARHLFPLASRLILTRGRSGRFRDPAEVAAAIQELGPRPEIIAELPTAIAAARSGTGPGWAICLTGSLYLVGDALDALAPAR